MNPRSYSDHPEALGDVLKRHRDEENQSACKSTEGCYCEHGDTPQKMA